MNLTVITEFFLLGFTGEFTVRILLLCLLLVVYCLTIYGNFLIITLVSTSKNLHTPMYFFISQLSITDILLSTDIVPNLLHILLNNGATMTFIDCVTQLYFFCAFEACECFLLVVMSYDRYVAICNPLRYTSIMTSLNCRNVTAICYIGGSSIMLTNILPMSMVTFCGQNTIDHFFCDSLPLLEIACSDTSALQLGTAVLSIPLIITPSTIIIVCYTNIIVTILRIPSNTGRQKAFSTCSSHLIVVSIFYWTMFGVYVVPNVVDTFNMSKILSLLYTVFTPFINPIIYSLRNKEIRKAIEETLLKYKM